MLKNVDRNQWLQYGIDNGFCSPLVCACHDGIPMTADEDQDWNDDGETCVFIVRPYADDQQRRDIESNFAPAVWRK